MNTELMDNLYKNPTTGLDWTSIARFIRNRYVSIVNLFLTLGSLTCYPKF